MQGQPANNRSTTRHRSQPVDDEPNSNNGLTPTPPVSPDSALPSTSGVVNTTASISEGAPATVPAPNAEVVPSDPTANVDTVAPTEDALPADPPTTDVAPAPEAPDVDEPPVAPDEPDTEADRYALLDKATALATEVLKPLQGLGVGSQVHDVVVKAVAAGLRVLAGLPPRPGDPVTEDEATTPASDDPETVAG